MKSGKPTQLNVEKYFKEKRRKIWGHKFQIIHSSNNKINPNTTLLPTLQFAKQQKLLLSCSVAARWRWWLWSISFWWWWFEFLTIVVCTIFINGDDVIQKHEFPLNFFHWFLFFAVVLLFCFWFVFPEVFFLSLFSPFSIYIHVLVTLQFSMAFSLLLYLLDIAENGCKYVNAHIYIFKDTYKILYCKLTTSICSMIAIHVFLYVIHRLYVCMLEMYIYHCICVFLCTFVCTLHAYINMFVWIIYILYENIFEIINS